MPPTATHAAKDDAVPHRKKERKGFKEDRRDNYLKRLKGGKSADKKAKPEKEKKIVRVKEVKFDDAGRKDYLLTLHKKKNERRVKALVDHRRRAERDSARLRRDQREKARLQYNAFARVPILPDYSYDMPIYTTLNEEEFEDGPGGEGSARDEILSVEGAGNDSNDGHASNKAGPATGKKCASASGASRRGILAPVSHMQALDGGDVTVEVRPLFGEPRLSAAALASACGGSVAAAIGTARKTVRTVTTITSRARVNPAVDFSDLPPAVAADLSKLREEKRGPSRTQVKIRMMKEMHKINKIKKHGRKGHGKKRSYGKRKNK